MYNFINELCRYLVVQTASFTAACVTVIVLFPSTVWAIVATKNAVYSFRLLILQINVYTMCSVFEVQMLTVMCAEVLN